MKITIKELRAAIRNIISEKIVTGKEDKCPKCKTMTPGDDQGNAYAYSCPKCGYRWRLEENIQKRFGEPLV